MKSSDSEFVHNDDEHFRSAFEHTNVAMVLTDMSHRFVRVNAAFAQLFGYSEPEVLQLSMPDITHPDDLADSYARREALLSGESHFFQMEKRYLHKDGHILWGLTNISMVRDADGQPFQYVGQVQDITERKRIEEQLRQAQKMEAVGRLAGGVAHDFNNSLTVIIGYSDVALTSLGPADPLREMIDEIKKAGCRAASLTRQLLAFSRKQVLVPEVLDLNSLLADMEKMLPRLIGEDIDLLVSPGCRLWQVKADAGQMEQVIMNLVVNARDAMPQGGKLTIETANIELDDKHQSGHLDSPPGQYVVLAVSDTGSGMDDATKSRIFEPFFTTKGPEQGTGLGLATVWGIVKQNGGYIDVYSDVELGTAFKIYLPRTQEAAVTGKSLPASSKPLRGTETILLAEDEDGVRALARLVLQSNGYTVLEAKDGAEALRLGQEYQDTIHLMVSDVVMPNLSGRQAAEQLAVLRPAMKVLYVSGYTDDAVVRYGVFDLKTALLEKPFSPLALVRNVREVLDHSDKKAQIRPPVLHEPFHLHANFKTCDAARQDV